MKRFVSALLTLALLALGGCGADVTPEVTTAEAASESVPESLPAETSAVAFTEGESVLDLDFGAVDWGVFGEGYDFDTYYAKTPEYFYFLELRYEDVREEYVRVLCRVHWDDFSERDEFAAPVPEEYNGRKVKGSDYYTISGVTSKWIFLTLSVWFEGEEHHSGGTDLVCALSLDGRERIFLGSSGLCNAWLNPYSLSLYTAKKTGQHITINALDLASGEKRPVFDGDKCIPGEDHGHYWMWDTDGKIMFRDDFGDSTPPHMTFVVIDKNDNAVDAYGDPRYKDWPHRTAKNEAERQLMEYNLENFVTCGDWVHYIYGSFCRIRPDGSGNEVLETETKIRQLLNVGGKLYAAVMRDFDDAPQSNAKKIVLTPLDERGKPLGAVEVGRDGVDSSWCYLREFHGKIMAYESGFGMYVMFQALYDPATGDVLRNIIIEY